MIIVPNNEHCKSYMKMARDILDAHYGPGFTMKHLPLLSAMMLVLSDDYQVGKSRTDPERILECKVILAGMAGKSGWKYDLLAPWHPWYPRDSAPGASWRLHYRELAVWALRMFGLRYDAWGQYLKSGSQITAKVNPEHHGEGVQLAQAALQFHFNPQSRNDVIGLLCYLPDNDPASPRYWTIYLGIDIDNHEKDIDPSIINNHRFAIVVYKRLVKLGYHPILSDSNGKGGFHLEVAFDTRIECWKSRAIGEFVTRDHEDYGLSKVEVFPKNLGLTPGGFGNWLRMVGHHHKRPHWSRILDMNVPAWLDGSEAVDYLLHHTKPSTYRDDPLVLEYWDKLMVPRCSGSITRQPSPLGWGPAVSQNGKMGPTNGKAPPVEQLTLTRTQLRDLDRCRSALKVCEDLDNTEIFRVAAALRAYGLDGRKVFLDWLNGMGPKAHWRVSSNNHTIGSFERQFDQRAISGVRVNGQEITIGSIYHYATTRGWVKPWSTYVR